MFLRRSLACSFCGRGHAEVRKLVAGPRVYICDACVAAASRLMEDDGSDELRAPTARVGLAQKLGGWLRSIRRRKERLHLEHQTATP